jgi:tRNA (Thr-GGU) A37 N-methylase
MGGKIGAYMFVPQPIGFVSSPYYQTSEIPKGLHAKHEADGVLFILWEFHRSGDFDLVGIPPFDDRPHGVFATRSPRRPNPIGLTVVELIRRESAWLHVRGVDMLDGTPILDIKPYLTSVPPELLRRGWLAEAESRQK